MCGEIEVGDCVTNVGSRRREVDVLTYTFFLRGQAACTLSSVQTVRLLVAGHLSCFKCISAVFVFFFLYCDALSVKFYWFLYSILFYSFLYLFLSFLPSFLPFFPPFFSLHTTYTTPHRSIYLTLKTSSSYIHYKRVERRAYTSHSLTSLYLLFLFLSFFLVLLFFFFSSDPPCHLVLVLHIRPHPSRALR